MTKAGSENGAYSGIHVMVIYASARRTCHKVGKMMVKPDLGMNVNEPIDTNAWPEPENDIATCSSVSASLCLDPYPLKNGI